MKKPQTFVGPRTWALIRESYLSGETAPVLAIRFGITKAAIRKRAWLEGWTKRDHAAALESARLGPPPDMPPAAAECGDRRGACPAGGGAEGAAGADFSGAVSGPFEGDGEAAASADPQRAVARAMRAASQALAQGRALEAQALVKAAEGLTRLSGQVGPLPLPEPSWMAAMRGELGLPEDTEAYEVFLEQVWAMAGEIAFDMLAETPDAPRLHARAVYAWRAKRLGPAVAARDLARARAGGWDKGLYDFNGRVLPTPHPGPALRAWLEEALARETADAAAGGG
jgi:hypothetical protein